MKLTVYMNDERVDAITMDDLYTFIAIDIDDNETNGTRFFPFSSLQKYLIDPKYTHLIFSDNNSKQLYIEKSKIAALLVD